MLLSSYFIFCLGSLFDPCLVAFCSDFGAILEGFWGPKSVILGIDVLMIFACRVKSGPRAVKSGPRVAKSGPRATKSAPRAAKSGQERPKSSQERLLGGLGEVFGHSRELLGAPCLGRSWGDLGVSPGSLGIL